MDIAYSSRFRGKPIKTWDVCRRIVLELLTRNHSICSIRAFISNAAEWLLSVALWVYLSMTLCNVSTAFL